jgi:putative transposase
MIELTHNKHSVGQSAYHLVWKPKYNVKVFLHPWVRKIGEEAIKDAAKRHNIILYELRVMPDHVHAFVEIPSTMSVSKALQLLKGASAREIFKHCTKWKAFFMKGHKKAHLWSPGKFFRSVGNVSADVVEEYIRQSQGGWDFSYLNKSQSRLNAF